MTKPIVAIIGRPNVGKSTLFNRLVGRRVAIVEDEPGTTRDRLYADVTWKDKSFSIVDTGGLLADPSTAVEELIKHQAATAIEEADVIIFVIDVLDGITVVDKDLAELLRRSGKPLVLAANKADNEQRGYSAAQFYELTLGDPVPISAYHGTGIHDLMDAVASHLPEVHADAEQAVMKIAIVGRPNVGKSMLLNAILGKERVIVSDKPGTTRDAIDTIFEWNGERILIIDTAGIRRRGRIDRGIERYSVDRASQAIERSDVAILVTEATDMLTAQDLHIAGFACEAYKGLVVVVNKWDLVEGQSDKRQCLSEIRGKLKFIPDIPVVFISALHGSGIKNVLKATRAVYEERCKRIPTAYLNNAVRDVIAAHAPPSVRGRKLNITYTTQAEINPPTFVFSINDKSLLHFSYERYLENQLRRNFGFRGTPLKLVFRQKGGQ
ncbi:MAG: ribosome biogenesis GTPase Der [Dehalococcoidia bacterium]|jgi:GTP-binding protein